MTETAATHTSAASNALSAASTTDAGKACGYCLAPFTPRRSWARYCSTACRNEANARKIGNGIRGVVSSVRIMRRGSVSVVLRFGLDERDRALKLEPGKVVGIEVPT